MLNKRDAELVDRLGNLVTYERRCTAEILELVKQVDERKLYLELGFTSLFQFMTERLRYSPASAQRRIDAARLLRKIPQLKSDVASGELNLTQISMVAQSLRQRAKRDPTSRQVSAVKILNQSAGVAPLLQSLKSKTLEESQLTIATALEVTPLQAERKSKQADRSTRLELTFTEEQMSNFQRVREVLSHRHPHLTHAELFDYLANAFLDKKDPLRIAERLQRKEQARPEPLH